MSNTLNWSYHEYEEYKAFTANVARLDFNGDRTSLVLNYSIIKYNPENFTLYFVCNHEMFTIGEYNTLELSQKQADQHHETFAATWQKLS